MPQRAFLAWELLFGFLLVLVFVVAGLNAREGARKGKPWRKRLVAAGFWAWAFLAVAPRAMAEELHLLGGKEEKQVLDPETKRALVKILVAQPGWEELSQARNKAWNAVLDSGRGKGPASPFFARLSEDLESASNRLEKIATLKALSAEESAYLRGEILFLRDATSRLEAYKKNPLSFRRYDSPNDSRFALEYLRRLGPALEALASAEVVKGKILEEVLPRLDASLRALEEMEMRFNIPDRDFPEARRRCEAGARVLEKLRKTARPPLDRNPLWKSFRKIWDKTRSCVSDPKIWRNLTVMKKRKLLKSLKPAFRLMDELERAGVFTAVEKKLLKEMYDRDHKVVERLHVAPLEEMGPRPTCYSPAPAPPATTPAKVSAQILKARLGVLRSLAKQDTVRQEVLVKLMETLEKQLRVLAEPKLEESFHNHEWPHFERIFKEARQLVIEVKQR